MEPVECVARLKRLNIEKGTRCAEERRPVARLRTFPSSYSHRASPSPCASGHDNYAPTSHHLTHTHTHTHTPRMWLETPVTQLVNWTSGLFLLQVLTATSGALQCEGQEEDKDADTTDWSWRREGDFFFGSDGQLRDSTFGFFPVSYRHRRAHHRDYPAAVEDVGVHRGQHHHSRGHVPGAVDVLRLPEHRTAPVQDLRLHPAARQWVVLCDPKWWNVTKYIKFFTWVFPCDTSAHTLILHFFSTAFIWRLSGCCVHVNDI